MFLQLEQAITFENQRNRMICVFFLNHHMCFFKGTFRKIHAPFLDHICIDVNS